MASETPSQAYLLILRQESFAYIRRDVCVRERVWRRDTHLGDISRIKKLSDGEEASKSPSVLDMVARLCRRGATCTQGPLLEDITMFFSLESAHPPHPPSLLLTILAQLSLTIRAIHLWGL